MAIIVDILLNIVAIVVRHMIILQDIIVKKY